MIYEIIKTIEGQSTRKKVEVNHLGELWIIVQRVLQNDDSINPAAPIGVSVTITRLD